MAEQSTLSLLVLPDFDASDSALVSTFSRLVGLEFRALLSRSGIEGNEAEPTEASAVAVFQGSIKICEAVFHKHHTCALKVIHKGIIYSLRCLSYGPDPSRSPSSGNTEEPDTSKNKNSKNKNKSFLPSITPKNVPQSDRSLGIPKCSGIRLLDLVDELGDDVITVTSLFREFKCSDDSISLWGAYSAIRTVLGVDFPVEYLLTDSRNPPHPHNPHNPHNPYNPSSSKGASRAPPDTPEDTPQISYMQYLQLYLKMKRKDLTDTGSNSRMFPAIKNSDNGYIEPPNSMNSMNNTNNSMDNSSSSSSNSSNSKETSRDAIRRARVRTLETDRSTARSEGRLNNATPTAIPTPKPTNVTDRPRDGPSAEPTAVLSNTPPSLDSAEYPIFTVPVLFPSTSGHFNPSHWLAAIPFWERVVSVLHRLGVRADLGGEEAAVSIEAKAVFLKFDINSMYGTGVDRDLSRIEVMLTDLPHIMTVLIRATVRGVRGGVGGGDCLSIDRGSDRGTHWWAASMVVITPTAHPTPPSPYPSTLILTRTLKWVDFLAFLWRLSLDAATELCALRRLISTEIVRNAITNALGTMTKKTSINLENDSIISNI